MSPAALLAAGLLVPVPAVYAPSAPDVVMKTVAEPVPWWDPLRLVSLGGTEDDEGGGFVVTLPLAPARSGEPAVRLLELADGDGPAGWVTETSLLSAALRSKGRLRADYWSDFDDTTRIGGQVVATTWVKRLAVDAEANYWQQSRDPFEGDRLGGTWWTGDANAVMNVADHPRGRVRTGGGAAWIVRDDGEIEAGPNATIACDFGLLSHAVAGFEVDWGLVGGDELFRWRVGGGWAFPGVQVRVGYDDYKLGSEDRAGAFAGVVLRY